MSINSKAQQVLDKQRLQQRDVEARERSLVNKRQLQNNRLTSLNNTENNRNDYGIDTSVNAQPLYGSLNTNPGSNLLQRNDLASGGSKGGNYGQGPKGYGPNKVHLGASIGLPQNGNSLPN